MESQDKVIKRPDFPPGTQEIYIPDNSNIRCELLKNIAGIVNKSIKEGYYPGAVILAAHDGKVIYRAVLGSRRIEPEVSDMTLDTIFDMASLTKVLVTTTAIMQLVEQGKLYIDEPVAKYWPHFSQNGKKDITIRHLLTHVSGLPGDLPISDDIALSLPTPMPQAITSYEWYSWKGSDKALKLIEQIRTVSCPGEKYIYSDLNFVSLQRLVEIVTGISLEKYAQAHIFTPLNMRDSFFLPNNTDIPPHLRDRIAPTQYVGKELRWGQVNDPTAYAMGGVAGHAGLFSTARDVGIYAQCLLNKGLISQENSETKKFKDSYLLSPLSILKMTTPQSPPQLMDIMGFGWNIDATYSNRGILFTTDSFGHTGWTGTSLWIDRGTKTWLVILTSRTHPTPTILNQLVQDRKNIADIVAASLIDVSIDHLCNTGKGELSRAFRNNG